MSELLEGRCHSKYTGFDGKVKLNRIETIYHNEDWIKLAFSMVWLQIFGHFGSI